MGKKIRFWTAAVIGAVMQYLYDPKAGKSRRTLLRAQITDRVLDARDARSPIKSARVLRLHPFRVASLRSAGRSF